MHDNPMGYSCEKRAEYVVETIACKEAFLECCRYIRGIRDEKQREGELILARSKYRALLRLLQGLQLGEERDWSQMGFLTATSFRMSRSVANPFKCVYSSICNVATPLLR